MAKKRKRRRSPYDGLPEVKRRKNAMYPEPKQAGDYLLEGCATITSVGRWDGRDWYRPDGSKMLRPKDIFGCWGPIPGTERRTVQSEEEDTREYLLMDYFNAPKRLLEELLSGTDGTTEDGIKTLARLASEAKLRITVHVQGADGAIRRWDSSKL